MMDPPCILSILNDPLNSPNHKFQVVHHHMHMILHKNAIKAILRLHPRPHLPLRPSLLPNSFPKALPRLIIMPYGNTTKVRSNSDQIRYQVLLQRLLATRSVRPHGIGQAYGKKALQRGQWYFDQYRGGIRYSKRKSRHIIQVKM